MFERPIVMFLDNPYRSDASNPSIFLWSSLMVFMIARKTSGLVKTLTPLTGRDMIFQFRVMLRDLICNPS